MTRRFGIIIATIFPLIATAHALTGSPDGTMITPGSGSFSDGMHVYTITAGGNAAEDGNNLKDGGGTSAGEWFNGLAYFQDSATKNWYTWNNGFVPASPPGHPSAETLTVTNIGQEVAGVPFTVAGSITGLTAAPCLQYWDNTGTPVAVPPAGVTATSYSFLHPALPIGTDTVSVWDLANHAATVQSNTFSVVALPPPPPPPGTPSPDKAVVLASSGATITDAAGNLWTISDGQVLENGKAPAFSSNVAEIAYVSGKVYQGNAGNQWYVWSGTAWIGGPNPFTSTCTYNPSAGQITCTNITP